MCAQKRHCQSRYMTFVEVLIFYQLPTNFLAFIPFGIKDYQRGEKPLQIWNLKISSLCCPTTTLPPPPLPKPTTPDKEAHPNPNTCIVICWSSLCRRTGNKRNEGRWMIVCGEVFVQAFQLGALFYWNPYQIHQFPFQIDLSTFDKIVIFGVSEMVNVFNNTSVPI